MKAKEREELKSRKRGAKQANSKARKNPERGREWFRVVVE